MDGAGLVLDADARAVGAEDAERAAAGEAIGAEGAIRRQRRASQREAAAESSLPDGSRDPLTPDATVEEERRGPAGDAEPQAASTEASGGADLGRVTRPEDDEAASRSDAEPHGRRRLREAERTAPRREAVPAAAGGSSRDGRDNDGRGCGDARSDSP